MKIDLSDVRSDIAKAEAARGRGEKWCVRCARDVCGLCAQCAVRDRSILPQLARSRIWEWQGRQLQQVVRVEGSDGKVVELSPDVLKVLRRKARAQARREERAREWAAVVKSVREGGTELQQQLVDTYRKEHGAE